VTQPWNATLYPNCAPTPTTQTLTQIQNSANITEQIPTYFIGSQPSGQFFTQTYTIYSNGTFVARDDAGNSFELAPVLGSPGRQQPADLQTTLYANSTWAVLHYQKMAGATTAEDVTVSYYVKKTFCQPSGLKIKIAGTISSGPRRISLRFTKAPGQVNSSSLWYQRTGGISAATTNSTKGQRRLGFDWSDSAYLKPSFIASNYTLTYRVGSSFVIDPTVIGSSTKAGPTGTSEQRKLFYVGGEFAAYYSNGTAIVCSSSATGASWSTPVVVTKAGGSDYGTNLAMWVSGGMVYYLLTPDYNGNSYQYGYGQLLGGCSVNWLAVTTEHPAVKINSGASIMVSGKSVYVAFRLTPGYVEYVYKNNTDTTFSIIKSFTFYDMMLLPLSSGKIAVIGEGGSYTCNYFGVATSSDGGSTWTKPVNDTGTCNTFYDSALAIGDTLYIAASVEYGPVMAISYTYGGTSFPQVAVSPNVNQCCTGNVWDAAISTDGTNFAIMYGFNNSIYYTTGIGSFYSWTPPSLIAGSEVSLGGISSSYFMSGSTFAAFWSAGKGPYQVRFAALPLFVDPAIAGQGSWSRPGLSPYESYFTGLNEYVSPGNGLLGVSQTDLSLPGRGLDLTIGRVYSTPYGFLGSEPFQYENYTLSNLGTGWSLDFPWMGTYYLHLGDGQAYPYQWSGNSFTYHGATDFQLNQTGYEGVGIVYLLFMKSGVVYTFGSNMSLLSVSDPTGRNVIKFRYGSNHFISQITDTVGRVVTFSYNANNQLTGISSGGRSWTYWYTGKQLTAVTDPLGRVTNFAYGGPNGWLLKTITYPTGGRTNYGYLSEPFLTDLTLRQVSLQNTYTTASNSSLTKTQSFSYTLDGLGNTLWSNSTVSDGHSVQGYTRYHFVSPKAYSRQYQYDGTGTLMQVSESDFDRLGRINETKLISPAGTVLAATSSLYDNWGNLIESTDATGQVTCYSYANTNSQNKFDVSFPSTPFYSNVITPSVRDALVGQGDYQQKTKVAQVTFYEYNYTGYLLETKESHGAAWLYTDYTYDKYGNVLTVKDPLGNEKFYKYGSAYSSAYLTQQSTIVSGTNVSESYTYDMNTGFQLSVTDGNGFLTSYVYDALGRVTKVTYPTVNGVVAVKTYSYNDAQNAVKVTDEDGHVVQEAFDGLGRTTSVTTYNGTNPYSTESYTYNWQNQVATDQTPAGNTYSYAYDYLGRPTQTTNPDNSFSTTSYNVVTDSSTATDENGHKTVTFYDRDGRTTQVDAFYSPTQSYNTTYSYDGVGNLLSVTDGNSNPTYYSYDDLNRQTSVQYADGSSQSTTYDSDGNVQSTTDAKGNKITYSYDSLNRLTTISFPNSTQYAYSYDQDNNLLKMTYPDPASSTKTDSTAYVYDARDRLSSETETIAGTAYTMSYTYDAASNVVSMKYPDNYAVAMTYDSLNRLHTLGAFATITYTLDNQVASVKYGDGQTATYTYNNRDEPTQILVKNGAVKQLDLNYTYDPAGNVLKIGSESYGYDYLNRLTSANGPWGAISYTYDAVGNRLTMTQGGSKTSYSYNNVNEMKSAGTTSYSYDANGNLIQQVAGSITWKYAYDYEDQLTSVTKSGSVVQKNLYDASGQRVQQTAGGVKTVYMYVGTNIVYYKAGSTVTKVFYAAGLQIARITGSTTFYYEEDELGSVRLVMSGGKVTFQTNYKPYGPLYGSSGSDPYEYTSKPYDSSTGLYYSSARYYDATTGRFVTRDPGGATLSDPQGLNAYAYARDNPLAIIDPTGMNWDLAASIAIGLLIGIAIVTFLPTGGISAVGAAALISDLAAGALSAGVGVAIGGAINAGVTAASNGGRVTSGEVALGFGLAVFGLAMEGGEGDSEDTLSKPTLADMQVTRIQAFLKDTLGLDSEKYVRGVNENGEPAILDIYIPQLQAGIESKYGYQALDTTTFSQLEDYQYLIKSGQTLSNGGVLKRMLYLASDSPVTGLGGLSKPYVQLIRAMGFSYIYSGDVIYFEDPQYG
jgi:RHS repeat-associated protein